MRVPNILKIGGHELKVKSHDDNQNEELGFYDSYRSQVSLNGSVRVAEDVRAECLLHEVLEVIVHLHNIQIDHKDLTTISEGLFAAIRLNDLDFRKP